MIPIIFIVVIFSPIVKSLLIPIYSHPKSALNSGFIRSVQQGSFHTFNSLRMTSLSERESLALTPSSNDIAPSVGELIKFGLPTLGIWLLQPILSLIDSSVVGIGGSVAALAALGPSIIWCDGTLYLLQFLGMATTNLYATALNEGKRDKRLRVLTESLFIAAILGTLLGSIQFIFAHPVISLLSGISAAEVLPYGMKYVRIRALGAPAALLTIVTQAAFLASKDAVTPLKAVLFGTGINLVGDIILVLFLNQGIVGAALATLFSQLGGFFYLVWVVYNIVKKNSIIAKEEMKLENKRVSEYQKLLGNKIETKDNNKNELITFGYIAQSVKLPTSKDLSKFLSFAGNLFFILFCKQILWTYATMCAASSGTVGLAAHQVTSSTWV